MNPLIAYFERHLGSHYRTEIVLGFSIFALIIVAVIGYFLATYFAPASTIEPVEEWSAEDKQKALEDLHATAREQGVPRLSDAEKLRVMQSIQNGQVQ